MTDLFTDAKVVEAVARAIDPDVFAQWQRQYDYCRSEGMDDDGASRIASFYYDIEGARRQARAALRAAAEAMAESGFVVVPVPIGVGCSDPPDLVLTYGTELEAVDAGRTLAVAICNALSATTPPAGETGE